MANGSTVQQNSGPVAKKGDQDDVRSIGIHPQELGDGAVGVLSRTIIPSTTIRWILPARIRHQDHNDVIFVGESFVQLREFLPTRHLADLPARLDMGCRILAAKVISHVDCTSFVDRVVKQEQREHGGSKRTTPPQILVLALDSSELAFVYAEDVGPMEIKFRVGREKLPADVSTLGQYGRHLAVDSKSCTIAVSPAYGPFGLLQLKTVPEVCEQIAALDANKSETFTPLIEERFVRVDGLILRMEFLVSPSTAPGKVILALLISKLDETYMLLYTWEEHAPLRYAKLEASSSLQICDRMPLMMIPSNQNASFTLVTESGLTVYDDVLTSRSRSINLPVPQTFPDRFVASSRSPLWVQWAKPFRHSGYLETNDDVFLVREDGELHYLEIKYKEPTKVSTRADVDSLNIGVDSAFAILEGPPDQGGDICVVGGDMTDGAVCHIRARAPLEPFQTIRNLAPIRDMLVLDTTSRNEDSQRVFVCTGKGDGHAAVAEIQHGLEARLGFFAKQEDLSVASGLWVVPENLFNQVTLLISYPSHTSSLRITLRKRSTEAGDGEHVERSSLEDADDDLADQGFQMSCQTLAFAGTKEGTLVQITTFAVTVLPPSSKVNTMDRKHSSGPVLMATIHVDAMLFSTVAMVDERFEVVLGSIDVTDTEIRINEFKESYPMTEEPSSILIFDVGGLQILTIGTILGSIYVLAIEPSHGARLISRYSTATLFPEIQASAICSLAFLSNPAKRPPALACGTRNGWLLGLSILQNPSSIRAGEEEHDRIQRDKANDLSNTLHLRPESAQHIGRTSVQLISDSENRSSVLLLCDSRIHHMTYLQSDLADRFRVCRVWYSDASQPELHQPKVSAVAALCRRISSGVSDLEATLFCLSASDLLLMSSLSLRPSTIPRKMLLFGDPCKLVFAEELGRLVVAIDRVYLIADTAPQRPAKRVVRPCIQFLDPDHHKSSAGHKQLVPLGQAGSRITSLLSWTPTNGTSRLQMVVVGLYIDGPDAAHCDGSLIYLTAEHSDPEHSEEPDNDLKVRIKHVVNYIGSPIYSLARYGLSSIVVCAGTDLFLRSLDISTETWLEGPPYTLPSPAVSLHVSGRLIYATTARHSLKTFQVEGGELTLRAKETKARDAAREASQFVGNDDGGMLASSTNKGGRVRGLSKQADGEFLCLFDARLPVTVNCLRESCSGDSIKQAGTQYYGSSQDGALYHFTTLSRAEWELLDFIARFTWKRAGGRKTRGKHYHHHHQNKSKGVGGGGGGGGGKEVKKFRPTDMHINGDRIVDLVRAGPGELRRLLEMPSCGCCAACRDQGVGEVEERWRQLVGLGGSLFGMADGDDDEEELVRAALRWMQKLVGGMWEG